MGKGRLFYEYGYFLNKVESLPFDGVFAKEIEENVRVRGGACPKNNIGREEAADIPDMETLVDMRRLISAVSALIEEKRHGNGITKKNGTGKRWDDFSPAPHDLLPFHAIMGLAVMGEDLTQPCFSSFLSEKTQVKITYHQGRRIVSPKKEVFT